MRSEPTIGDVGRNHRVFVVVDNCQAEHQGTIVEAIGTLHGISNSILFDSSAFNSFISPSLVQRCGLVAMHQVDRWQVELATGSKVAVDSLIRSCVLNLGTFTTIVDLCGLPLGSYDIVLGMDWLASHQENINFHHKVVQCVDDTGGQVELLGVLGPVSLRLISANQLKWSVQKGC